MTSKDIALAISCQVYPVTCEEVGYVSNFVGYSQRISNMERGKHPGIKYPTVSSLLRSIINGDFRSIYHNSDHLAAPQHRPMVRPAPVLASLGIVDSHHPGLYIGDCSDNTRNSRKILAIN